MANQPTSIIIGLTSAERAFHEQQLITFRPDLEGNPDAIQDELETIATLAFRASLLTSVLQQSANEAQTVIQEEFEKQNRGRVELEQQAAEILRPIGPEQEHPNKTNPATPIVPAEISEPAQPATE